MKTKHFFLLMFAIVACTNVLFADALPGLFSVSADKQIRFSSGNLQYNAALGSHRCADGTTQQGTWRFAEHQWDMVGIGYGQTDEDNVCRVGGTVTDSDNKNISSIYNGWIDLFGWGTSGWNGGAICYQPWSSTLGYDYYYPGGSYENSLTGQCAYADWGVYNQIGEYAPGSWRTLSRDECYYLLVSRQTDHGNYGIAKVNGIPGMVILPDEWTLPTGCSFTAYEMAVNKNLLSDWSMVVSTNIYNVEQWAKMESAGAVFLPCGGYREHNIDLINLIEDVTNVTSVGVGGFYWTSSPSSYVNADALQFDSRNVFPASWSYRDLGCSVRLVAELTDAPTYTLSVTIEGEGIVSGAGQYKLNEVATLTATPASGYTFTQWSDGNTDNPRTITMTEDMTLTAIFKSLAPTVLKDASGDNHTLSIRKVMRDGVLYILTIDGKMYNQQGAEVR